MLIFAFDTTSEHGGAGIFRDEECLALVPNTAPANQYSVTLFDMADLLVQEVRRRLGFENFTLREVELIAAANGPGSFTGIRVGLAAAQAWSKAFGRPARGVSVLEAMAAEASPEAGFVVPVLDARRGEFYLGVYRRDFDEGGRKFLPEGEPQAGGPEAIRAAIEERHLGGANFVCVVRAGDAKALDLLSSGPARPPVHLVRGTLVPAIARLALAAERAGASPATPSLDAQYIRRSDAEIHWKD